MCHDAFNFYKRIQDYFLGKLVKFVYFKILINLFEFLYNIIIIVRKIATEIKLIHLNCHPNIIYIDILGL